MRSTANHNCIAQLSLAGLAWVAALSLLPDSAPAAPRTDEQPLEISGTGITVYGPAYVLDNFIHREGTRLVFVDRDGRSWALVEDASSPIITNKGDGSFHPFDIGDVSAAIRAISYPIDDLDIEIFVLPFPREEALGCSTGDGAIYLSPGVFKIREEQAHMLVTHEMGHCVHRALMPERDRRAWNGYRRMRGIDDMSAYNTAAAHMNRPNEIFAEDFRWLFGGDLSKYSGTIENGTLALPDAVPGLRDFMLSLAQTRLAGSVGRGGAAPVRITSYPNPFSKSTTVSVQTEQVLGSAGHVRSAVLVHALVLDAAGRAVKDLGMRDAPGSGTLRFRWDGTDDYGRRLASGVYFLRVDLDGLAEGSAHKMLLRR